MNRPPNGRKTILLASQPGLGQLSLQATVNALPNAIIVAIAADIEDILGLAKSLGPDILLIDAYFASEQQAQMLVRAVEECPDIVRIVLVTVALQHKEALLSAGADHVLIMRDLNQQLLSILDRVE